MLFGYWRYCVVWLLAVYMEVITALSSSVLVGYWRYCVVWVLAVYATFSFSNNYRLLSAISLAFILY